MTPKQLRDWRHKHVMTMEGLGAFLGIHRLTIQRWEGGKAKLPKWLPYALTGVAHALGAGARASRPDG